MRCEYHWQTSYGRVRCRHEVGDDHGPRHEYWPSRGDKRRSPPSPSWVAVEK
jgi:hypothetical protein